MNKTIIEELEAILKETELDFSGTDCTPELRAAIEDKEQFKKYLNDSNSGN
jgi:hypothetical protein